MGEILEIQCYEKQKRKTNRDELPGSPRGINELEIHTFVEESINLAAWFFSARTWYPSHRAQKMGFLWKANPVPNIMNSVLSSFEFQFTVYTQSTVFSKKIITRRSKNPLPWQIFHPENLESCCHMQNGKPLVSTAGQYLLEGTGKNFQLSLTQCLTIWLAEFP